jgi:BirA family transcriptional regulator, biotin operon repressor / biotin---[acetyl-CoA-carboxylase] ligase
VTRILLDATPSTNDYALDLLRGEHPAEGTVIQTLRQTRGRGQRDAVWESEPGSNLTVSVILYPVFLELRRQFDLAKAAALGVADCVSALSGTEPAVKWPNDVLLGGRKVAGILIENRIAAGRIDASVVGIGLNVNQTSFAQALGAAGSLRAATGRTIDLEAALEALHGALLARYYELRDTPERTARDYLLRIHGLGEELGFVAAGRAFRGTIRGVDEEGRLLVNEAGGETHAFRVRDVQMADPAFDKPGEPA